MMRIAMIVLLVDSIYLTIRFLWRLRDKDRKCSLFHFVHSMDRYHKRSFQFICGIITKHPPSKTEWGYGGGDYADRWCKWCDKQLRVPKESVYFTNPISKELMKQVKGDGK